MWDTNASTTKENVDALTYNDCDKIAKIQCDEFGNVIELQLGYTGLSGKMNFNNLRALSELKELNMGYNKLEGEVLSVVFTSLKLETVNLAKNIVGAGVLAGGAGLYRYLTSKVHRSQMKDRTIPMDVTLTQFLFESDGFKRNQSASSFGRLPRARRGFCSAGPRVVSPSRAKNPCVSILRPNWQTRRL